MHVLRVTYLVILLAHYSFCLVCDNSKTITLTGAGTSSVSSTIKQIAARYTTNRSVVVGRNVVITYDAGSFDSGLKRIQGLVPGLPTVLFGIGDAMFPGASNPKPDILLTIPSLVEAIVVNYNLPDIPNLNLSMKSVADIYMGKITRWNDTSLQRDNPAVKLPPNEILAMGRADGAAQTRLLTQVLSASVTEWNDKYGEIVDPGFVGGDCCNSTEWPQGVVDLWGNKAIGMSGLAVSIPYMIGYGVLGDSVANGIQVANIINPKGIPIPPNADSMREALDYWTARKPNETYYKLHLADDPQAYPITAFLYAVLNTENFSNFSCCVLSELVGFIHFVVWSLTDEQARANSMITVPNDPIASTVTQRVLANIYCDGESMLDAYIDSLQSPTGLETWKIGLIAAGCVVVLGFGVGLSIFFWWRALNDEKIWQIPAKSLNLQSILTSQSISSLQHSSHSGKSQQSLVIKSRDEISLPSNNSGGQNKLQFPMAHTSYDDKIVFLLELNLNNQPKSWRRETKLLMFKLVQKIAHPCLLHLYGTTVIGNKVFILQESSIKGTLHFVLSTSRFELTDTIKCSMAVDVAEAMAYLHSRGLIHGQLSSMTCYVANSWIIKVANWMLNAVLTRESPYYIDELVSLDRDELKNEKTLLELLSLHPSTAKTRKFSQISDVFSYGMLLVELINRQIPYAAEVQSKQTSYYKIIKNKLQLEVVPFPELQSTHPSPALEKMARTCLTAADESKANRDSLNSSGLSFYLLAEELKKEQFQGGGITDILMDNMEGMIVDMEKKSTELSKVTGKMKSILNEVLPPSIAEKFILGQTVEPEFFESATIFFSDIVGFTTISSRSSPMEVMTFLNDLWIAFDYVIDQFDCYKVDTIGDAYMVCSGLPKRNGIMHVKHIADLAHALLERSSMFVIRHMPQESLRVRIGMHSGAVTAGVVGLKMPQYCVFGDTVTTASKMESTGSPGKIQVSEVAAKLLSNNFPRYRLERRGDIDIKGKGQMASFWLEPPVDYSKPVGTTLRPAVGPATAVPAPITSHPPLVAEEGQNIEAANGGNGVEEDHTILPGVPAATEQATVSN